MDADKHITYCDVCRQYNRDSIAMCVKHLYQDVAISTCLQRGDYEGTVVHEGCYRAIAAGQHRLWMSGNQRMEKSS